jgi:hypothetical protein
VPASARQAPARGLKPPQHSPKVQRCLQEVDYQKQRSWDLGRDSIHTYIYIIIYYIIIIYIHMYIIIITIIDIHVDIDGYIYIDK